MSKFDEKVLPAINQLRQSLAAIERAKRDGYPAHVSACMKAAQFHATRAAALIQRAAP